MTHISKKKTIWSFTWHFFLKIFSHCLHCQGLLLSKEGSKLIWGSQFAKACYLLDNETLCKRRHIYLKRKLWPCKYSQFIGLCSFFAEILNYGVNSRSLKTSSTNQFDPQRWITGKCRIVSITELLRFFA